MLMLQMKRVLSMQQVSACGEVVDADVTDEAGVKYATGEYSGQARRCVMDLPHN